MKILKSNLKILRALDRYHFNTPRAEFKRPSLKATNGHRALSGASGVKRPRSSPKKMGVKAVAEFNLLRTNTPILLICGKSAR